MDEISLKPNRAKTLVYIGAAAIVVSFMFHATSMRTENGRIVEFRDNVMLGCGIAAAICGAIAAVLARKEDRAYLASGLAVLAVAAIQILRGLGIVMF
ncbi:MAG: hypothetical protein QM831_03660 [Kofleriaceae bacterium]